MVIAIRLMSCLVALLAATALFVHGLFVQTGLETSGLSAIGLFGLAIGCFGLSTFLGLRLRDALIDEASTRSRHR